MSIHSHSIVSPTHCIFSVFQQRLSNERNTIHHNMVRNALDTLGISYKIIEGCYLNSKELSFIVDYDRHKELLHYLAIHYDQESILILEPSHRHGTRKASLFFPKTNKLEPIGNLVAATKERAMKETCYSYRPDLNQYWIVVSEDDLTTYAV